MKQMMIIDVSCSHHFGIKMSAMSRHSLMSAMSRHSLMSTMSRHSLMSAMSRHSNVSYVKAFSNVRNVLLLFVTDLPTRWIKQKIICISYLYSKCNDCCIQWKDDVYFVLDQHAWLDLYSASSLKQQSVCRYVTSLGHIILIPKSISLLLSLKDACLRGKHQIPIL